MIATGSSFHPTGFDFSAGIYLVYSMLLSIPIVAAYHAKRSSLVRNDGDLARSAGVTGFVAAIAGIVAGVVMGEIRSYELRHGVPTLLKFVMVSSVVYTLGVLTFVAMVAWYRLYRGVRVVVQEATYCPSCGADLSGKQSFVCRSCGNAFALDDLRTREEFPP